MKRSSNARTSRWEMIIILSIIAGYALAIAIDALAKELTVEPVIIEEVVEKKEVKFVVKIDWTEERIKEEVWKSAKKYNTFPEKMWRVMLCENTDLDIDLQSHHTYTETNAPKGYKVGDREESYGLAQIHIPVHNTTYQQAIDPEYAIDFMAKHFAEGRASWWTCYRDIYQ